MMKLEQEWCCYGKFFRPSYGPNWIQESQMAQGSLGKG